MKNCKIISGAEFAGNKWGLFFLQVQCRIDFRGLELAKMEIKLWIFQLK